jgi:hypothetical protein
VAGAFDWRFQGCPHVGGGLAATSDRRLHALSWTGEEEHAGLYALSSSDGGREWSAPQRVGGDGAHRSDLAAAGARLAAVWDRPETSGRAVLAAFSDDGGRTWTAPRRLSDAAWNAAFPLVASTGSGFVAFWTESQADAPARWRSMPLQTD